MALITGNSNVDDNLQGDNNLTTPESDEIIGYSGNDTINGGLGFDTIDGGTDDDGGVDNDLLIVDYTSLAGSGETGIESSSTYSDENGESNGYLYGLDDTNAPSQVDFININRFQVTGTAKNDSIFTGAGNDTLAAGAGDDTLTAGAGINVIDAGAGTDTLVDANFAAATTDLSLDDLESTADSITLDDGTSVSNVENFTNVTTVSGNDAIAFSQSQDNNINTGSGDDVINSGLGSDNIDGGADNDLLIVDYSSLTGYEGTGIGYSTTYSDENGESNGYLYGDDPNGDGYINFNNINRFQVTGTEVNDFIVTGAGDDTLAAGTGDDTLDAGDGNNTLDAGEGNDALYAVAGNDTLTAGAGNDTLTAGEGINIIDAGAGIDTLIDANFAAATTDLSFDDLESTADTITLEDGTSISNVENFTNVTTGSGDDAIAFSQSKDNTINTGSGDDVINSGLGYDNVDGGTSGEGGVADNDLLIVDYSSLTGSGETGIPYSDAYTNENGETSGYIYGYDDTNGGGYINFNNINRLQVTGTEVNDFVVTGDGDDTINAGAGDDFLVAKAGNNTLDAGDGNDTLYTYVGNDTIDAGAGDDYLDAGAGINVIDGGAGTDTLVDANFASATTDLSLDDLETTADSILLEDGTSVSNVENFTNVTTGNGDDTIAFSQTQNNSIITGSGDDIINSGLGYDNVDGGISGEDGVTDDDLLIVDYSNLAGSGETGIQSGWWSGNYSDNNGESHGSFGAYDTTNSYDQVSFSNINRFQITGTAVNDVVVTGAGDDTLVAGAGDDTLSAGAGNDSLDAGEGNDSLTAGEGINVIDGGAGIDTLVDANFAAATTDLSFDDLETTADSILLEDGTSVSNVENFTNVTTGSGDDAIAFSQTQNNSIITGSGDDIINSGLGYDNVDGGISGEDGVTDNDLLIVDYSNLAGSGETGIQSGWWNYSDENGESSGNFSGSDEANGNSQTNFSNINRFQITGTAVNDNVVTWAGDDTLVAGAGDDTLSAGAGNDSLDAGEGNDSLTAGEGINVIDGGEGTDTLVDANFATATTDLSLDDLETTANTITLNDGTSVSNVENFTNVTTGSGDDAIAFSQTQNNSINTGSGDDTINSGLGYDYIDGGTSAEEGVTDDDLLIVDYSSVTGYDGAGIQSYYNYIDENGESSGYFYSYDDTNGYDQVGFSNINRFQVTGTAVNDVVVTGAGDDTLAAGAGNDTLTAGAGDDALDGGAGNDALDGGEGNDLYVINASGDTVTETSDVATEIDTVQSGVTHLLGANVENLTLTGVNPINGIGNALDNTIMGNAAANTLSGNTGNDVLTGGDGNDAINGGFGGDILNGGIGNDAMNGNAGGDTYIVDAAGDTVTEASNAVGDIDTVKSGVEFTLGANLENLTLTGENAINGTGNTLNNTIMGNAAANTLDGGEGDDAMTGGEGDDIYVVDAAGDTVAETSTVAEEIDTVQSGVAFTLGANLENLTLTGENAIDGIGNATGNNIMGNAAANTLFGNSGRDVLAGGDGNDTINGGSSDDTLDGGAGNDSLFGAGGEDNYIVDSLGDVVKETSTTVTEIDTVQSGVDFTLGKYLENLTLTGENAINGTGNSLGNTIMGNAAANTLDGGVGNDAMTGGLGNDIYVVDAAGDTVTETSQVATEIDTVQSGVSFTLGANLENLTLTTAKWLNSNGNGNTLDNTIAGNIGNNKLDGADGNDKLIGNSGNDVLIGGVGNDAVSGGYGGDILNGGAGNDAMNGGAGNDTYVVDSSNDVVYEASATSTEIDLTESSVNHLLTANVENLTLTGASAINGSGNALNNTIVGNTGNNKLDGGLGDDKLIGNTGNDILTGSSGNDAMSGGYGLDILTGGAGDDNMNGGASNDKFLYDTNAIFASSEVGIDRIADFVSGTDKIVLDQTTFSDLTSTIGNGFSVASEFAVVGSDAAASTADALIVYSSATDHLFYNQNGSAAGLGSGANFATLSGIDNLSADDFVLQA